jgi:transposase
MKKTKRVSDDTATRRINRPDLPQIVFGLAVTKEGIPVKCWTMPGNTSDMKTVERMKEDLRGWKLGRCISVMDRGMNSEENRLILQRAGGHYIIGEKLRDSQEAHETVLAKRGRFTPVRENLEIKEVIVGDGERRRRFILVYNPEEAKRDKATLERTVKRNEEALAAVGDQTGKCHGKNVCAHSVPPDHGAVSEAAEKRGRRPGQGEDPSGGPSGREVYYLHQ